MKYKSLNYVGKSKKAQIDTLLNKAAADKCIPIYIFYNYVNNFPTINCRCGKTIHDFYEGVTYSFGPTVKGIVGSGGRKGYGYHEVRPFSDFLVCLFCCNNKSKSLISAIVDRYKEFSKSKVEGYIKEKVPKYVKKISPDIQIETEDKDLKELPKFVIVTQLN
nr:hypothetical protein [Bacillus kexueae]